MRYMKRATWVMAVTVALSGLALAHDRDRDDDYDRGDRSQARQYGYRSGYRDGLRKGQHEGRENDPGDFRTRQLERADHGYKGWMGPRQLFREGYREGYRAGFENGFRAGRWRDRNDRGPRYGWRSGQPWYPNQPGYDLKMPMRNPGYNFGYQDGALVARQDIASHKPYNPDPRGRYDDRDHGYRSEYGDKDGYRWQYASGYRTGYEAVFGQR